MTPRLVVFDVDGTLIDSQHAILAAMRQAFLAMGADLPGREAVLAIVGLSLPEAIGALAPDWSPAAVAEGATAYKRAFRDLHDAGRPEAASPLFPGAAAALDRLGVAPGTRLGIATGKARGGLDQVLVAHGLAGRFATEQTADLHPSKPHPAMLAACAAETGVPPGRAVMVGDTAFDIAMGRAAGFATIAVSWGYHPVERLRAAGPDAVIDGFGALDDAIDGLLGP